MPRDPLTPSGPTYLLRATRAALAHPRDALEKVLERVARRREQSLRHGERPHHEPDVEWERRVHELIGASWPCRDAAAFAPRWAEATETMAARGLDVGRENYGDDDDADPGLARTLWCLVCHLRPGHVVETGVAHGLSSRMMLEALQRVGDGRLSSIDLPAMTIHQRRTEIGAAVPAPLRDRWSYLEGSSRRRLPPLLREAGQIDLFVHDSLHSTRNVRWELETAWKILRPGGVVVVDDVDFNWGFEEFLAAGEDRQPLWCMADDGLRVFALARKVGAVRT